MKTLLQTLFFFLLFLITVFPQDKIHRAVIPEKPTTERLRDIHKPNVDDLQGLNDRESLLLKSKSINWKTALRNPQREFYEEEGFNAKDTRTTINKTLLGNGFLLIEEIRQTWNGSAWVNQYKSSYTYDVNNNLTEYLYQTWNGSAWVNSSKFSYTYDGNDNRTEELYQTWNGSAWVNGYRQSYTYDGNNYLTEVLELGWDGSAWVNSNKHSYTYDGNNNLTEWLWQDWDGSAWVNHHKYSYTYDGNNNQTEGLYQTWDGSTWVNYWKESYTYDGNNNLTESLYQTWNGSAWVNSSKFSYTYDGNNNRTEELWQTWVGSAWVNDWKESYTYDGNNNLTEWLFQNWDSSAWVNVRKYSYTYIPVTEVNEDLSSVNSYSLSNNYPNPFNPNTVISYQLPVGGDVLLKIYDILGNEVATLVDEYKPAGRYEIEFNSVSLPSRSGSALTSGVYFYQLKAGEFLQTKKMLLLK